MREARSMATRRKSAAETARDQRLSPQTVEVNPLQVFEEADDDLDARVRRNIELHGA
jgi:hypothetical protein